MKTLGFRSAVVLLLLTTSHLLPLHSNAQTVSSPSYSSDPGAKQRFWIQGEYLHWWMKGNQLPPLVTSSPPGTNGTLPGSAVLFGGQSVDSQGRNGGRVSGGYWLDGKHRWGLDAGLILIGFNGGTHFSAASNGTPLLARPFNNVLAAANDALLVAAPGIATGTVSASSGNNLQSVSLALRRNLQRKQGHHVDVVLGYRYFHFTDTLTIGQSSLAMGTTIAGMDRFAANNSFHGGEVGLEGGIGRGHWSADLAGRVALGAQNITGNISGTTSVGSTTFVGNLLALSSNIGSQSKTSFAVLPQMNVTGRYSFSKFSLSAGYTFLYLNSVLRTGGQIDENVNPSLLPPPVTGGPASPQAKMNRSTFWAQGISAGLQYRF